MPRWDDPGTVAFFRDRPPDHRLVALVAHFSPASRPPEGALRRAAAGRHA